MLNAGLIFEFYIPVYHICLLCFKFKILFSRIVYAYVNWKFHVGWALNNGSNKGWLKPGLGTSKINTFPGRGVWSNLPWETTQFHLFMIDNKQDIYMAENLLFGNTTGILWLLRRWIHDQILNNHKLIQYLILRGSSYMQGHYKRHHPVRYF